MPQDWYATVAPALVRAWPSVVRATTVSARTPLNYALETRAPKAAVLALIAAAPEAAKQADRLKSWQGYCPLPVALKKKANEVVVLACETARVPTCRILVESAGGAGGTPERPRQCPPIQSNPFTMFSHGMLISFRPNSFLTSVISTLQALMTVHPGAVTAEIPGVGGTALHVAVTNNASDAVVRGLIGLYRGAIMQTTTIVLEEPPHRHRANAAAVEPAIRGGGDTILHLLATAVCTTTVEVRNTNTLCFTLVEKGASVTATNALGRTPAEAATDDPKFYWRLNNQHLVANFREIRMYKARKHLSRMHFRDWTTVSHAWCTPSAKLVALTVLLVGETYKRGLLPRLPMDCWYMILNRIPRHELRQGGCEPDEEGAALATYSSLLREARAVINAKAAQQRTHN